MDLCNALFEGGRQVALWGAAMLFVGWCLPFSAVEQRNGSEHEGQQGTHWIFKTPVALLLL